MPLTECFFFLKFVIKKNTLKNKMAKQNVNHTLKFSSIIFLFTVAYLVTNVQ